DGDRLRLASLFGQAGEKFHLRLEIVLHCPVKIEVVLGEIVKTATSHSRPRVRSCASACEETSIAAALQPALTICASSSCKSRDSGVVRMAGRRRSPISYRTVPINTQLIPARSQMCLMRNVVVVLPFVPVTAA